MRTGASGTSSSGFKRRNGSGGLSRSSRQPAQGQASRSCFQLMRPDWPSLQSMTRNSPSRRRAFGDGGLAGDVTRHSPGGDSSSVIIAELSPAAGLLRYNPLSDFPPEPGDPERMPATASIFLDLNLPNPTTWFYFSGLLAVALFFKFSRLLSIRNLDVLTLFLFMPGLLLLAEGGPHDFVGYLWLIVACFYFLVRCFLDLALVRRPALAPNLDAGGLAWLTGALFVGLVAVAARQPVPEEPPVEYDAPTDSVRKISEKAIQPYVPDSRLRFWAERGLALACHLSVVVGLVLVGWRHFDDVRAGLAAATFYLLLPYTYMLLPDSPLGVGRWDHAWAMAFLVWSVF